MKTRPCTKLILVGQKIDEDIHFDCRDIPSFQNHSLKAFRPDADTSLDETMERIKRCAQQAPPKPPPLRPTKTSRKKPPWKDVVNNKRRRVQKTIEGTNLSTNRALSKEANASKTLTKRILCLMAMEDDLPAFDYPNQHSQQTIHELDDLIEDRDNRYQSAAGFKRQLSTRVSKKFIRKRLRSKGFKYKRIKPLPQKQRQERYEDARVPLALSSCTRALEDDQVRLFFLDEVKFPLHSTGSYAWVAPGQDLVFNDRPENLTLSVVAICSLTGFEAIQVFLEEITSVDTLFFLVSFLNSLEVNKPVMILLDNAKWHVGNVVRKSPVFQYLSFNSPKLFEVNLIENSFSAVKTEFRGRRMLTNLGDEVHAIVEIFNDPRQSKRFLGYHRELIRQLRRIADHRIELNL